MLCFLLFRAFYNLPNFVSRISSFLQLPLACNFELIFMNTFLFLYILKVSFFLCQLSVWPVFLLSYVLNSDHLTCFGSRGCCYSMLVLIFFILVLFLLNVFWNSVISSCSNFFMNSILFPMYSYINSWWSGSILSYIRNSFTFAFIFCIT